MTSRQLCVVTLLCLSGLHAETPPAKAGTSSSSSAGTEAGEFVRRISAGGTLSFLPINLMTGGNTTQDLTDATITTSGSSHSNWFGGGVVVQYAFKERWAVVANFLIRRPGYQITTTGTNDSATTTTTEQTRATYWDVPLLVRHYNIGRHHKGFRWFYEGGLAARWTVNVNTQIQTVATDSSTSDTTTTCCDAAPAVPAHKLVGGAVAGAGFQLVDDFGIRVVPEFRYTRWLQPSFSMPTASSNLNQIEVLLSVTF
jgi:hypothetical protein